MRSHQHKLRSQDHLEGADGTVARRGRKLGGDLPNEIPQSQAVCMLMPSTHSRDKFLQGSLGVKSPPFNLNLLTCS